MMAGLGIGCVGADMQSKGATLGTIVTKRHSPFGTRALWSIPVGIVCDLLELCAMTVTILNQRTYKRLGHRGQTMVELALILGLVVLMAIGALQGMGGALKSAWDGEMKPTLQAPKAPLVAAKQSVAAPTFAEATGTAGDQVSYEINDTSANACWDGNALNAGEGGDGGGWDSGIGGCDN